MPLKSSMPVAEQRAQPYSDDWCRWTQGSAQLEGDAVTHNGFGVTVGRDSALVPPRAHVHHRGLLVETTFAIEP